MAWDNCDVTDVDDNHDDIYIRFIVASTQSCVLNTHCKYTVNFGNTLSL